MSGSVSRSGRPSRSIAGELPVSLSGVLRMASSALVTPSLLTLPSPSVFSRRALLTAFTATSARPFEAAWCADDSLCWTPHLLRKFSNSLDVYSGPPSLEISTGTHPGHTEPPWEGPLF